MNELTIKINFYLWLLLGFVEGTLLILYFVLLFYILFKIKNDGKRIKENYSYELNGFDILFLSKTIKKINLKIQYSINNTLVILPVLSIIVTFFIMEDSLYLFQFKLQFKYIWLQLLLFFLVIIFHNLILFVTSLILLKIKNKDEVEDDELIKCFYFFIDKWIEKYGVNKIRFETLSERRRVNLIFYKLQNKLNPLLLKYKKRYPKTYKFWYIERFRTYLDAINKNLFFLKTVKQFDQIPIIILNDDGTKKHVGLENLKFLLIHNYVCEVFKINTL